MDIQNHQYKKEIQAFNEAFLQNYSDNNSNPDSTYAKILIKFLIDFINQSTESTIQGLTQNLQIYAKHLINCVENHEIRKEKTNLVFKTTCEIFFAYLNKNYPKETDIILIKKTLIELGYEFIEYLSQTLDNIVNSSKRIIKNGATFIVIGHSLLIENILIKMASKSVRFSVIVPESRPSCKGYDMCNRLVQHHIPTQLIIDSALPIYLDDADFVISAAEAVVENGGIINEIGTYSSAIISFFKKKPFYVLSESFKISKIFPLSQKDIINDISKSEKFIPFNEKKITEDVAILNPQMDYTPPDLITLLVTDRGIFTPSAVSDELIQMFGK